MNNNVSETLYISPRNIGEGREGLISFEMSRQFPNLQQRHKKQIAHGTGREPGTLSNLIVFDTPLYLICLKKHLYKDVQIATIQVSSPHLARRNPGIDASGHQGWKSHRLPCPSHIPTHGGHPQHPPRVQKGKTRQENPNRCHRTARYEQTNRIERPQLREIMPRRDGRRQSPRDA